MPQESPRISFEFFPPKTDALEESLLNVAQALAPFQPEFVSVTYGAGGSTRDRTHRLVMHLRNKYQLNVAAHLTCVETPKKEIDEIAAHYWQEGVKHIVALRGDVPDNHGSYRPHPDGYAYASDLVTGLRDMAPFQISVAAYPETHPEAISAEADLENLKRKMAAGASQAITQFFLDTEVFLRFRDRAVALGITQPIIPGLLPVSNFPRACEFAAKCGASVPASATAYFAGHVPGTEAHQTAAFAFAAAQIDRLQSEGVEDFHFYTLNRTELMIPLCEKLKPQTKSALNV